MKQPCLLLPTNAPTGTQVIIVTDNNGLLFSITQSKPWKLGHGAWVVKCAGIVGGYDLKRIYRLSAPWESVETAKPVEGEVYLTISGDDASSMAHRWFSDGEDHQDGIPYWSPMPWDGEDGPEITHFMLPPPPPEDP